MSETLVIHPKDETTVMLDYVYEGKGFDVINDPDISRMALKEAIAKHERIIMLGHGGGVGLAHPNAIHYGRPGKNGNLLIIDDSLAESLRGKKSISMWCYSDQYFLRNNLPGFHTGMIISEESEAMMMLGECPLSEKELFDNMVYLSRLLGDCLDMEPEKMREYILSRYNFPDAITQFNRRNIRVL